MSDEKLITITAYINPDQFAHLKALSAATGVPFAVFIREGIDMILKDRNTAEARGELFIIGGDA